MTPVTVKYIGFVGAHCVHEVCLLRNVATVAEWLQSICF
jgi:hypothetical protein